MEGDFTNKRLKETHAELGAARPLPQSSMNRTGGTSTTSSSGETARMERPPPPQQEEEYSSSSSSPPSTATGSNVSAESRSEQFRNKRYSEKVQRVNQPDSSTLAEEEGRRNIAKSLDDVVKADGGRCGFSQTPVLPPAARSSLPKAASVPQSVCSLLTGGVVGSSSRSSTTTTKTSSTTTTTTRAPPATSSRGHTICSISENVERETAIVSIDATSLTVLTILKQTNSMTYAETLVALEMLQPDEILMNEGRRSSELALKVRTEKIEFSLTLPLV